MLGCVLLGFFSVHVFFFKFRGGGGGVDWLCGGFLYCAGFGLPYIYVCFRSTMELFASFAAVVSLWVSGVLAGSGK